MSTWTEQRRLDRAAEREQDREDRRLELEARLEAKREAAELKRLEDEAKAEKERRDAAEKRRLEQLDKRARDQERERKQAARRAKLTRVGRWLNANPVTVFVGFVMVSSIVPAVISQVGALGDAKVNLLLAALLAAMLEGGAWALTFMGKQAEDAGRPAGKYRAGTWTTAVLAAAVNYWHWAEKLPQQQWVAFVFAASSLFAILLWDMKTHGSSGKTREERQREKARRKHLANRRKDHKDVAREADRLLSALPFESISEEDAFAAAWQIKKGAQQGLDAKTYASLTNAQIQLGAAFELAEHVRPELVRTGLLAAAYNPLKTPSEMPLPALGPVFPWQPQKVRESAGSSQVANQVPPTVLRPVNSPTSKVDKQARKRSMPPRRQKGDTPRFHTAARVAAADTARRATVTVRTD